MSSASPPRKPKISKAGTAAGSAAVSGRSAPDDSIREAVESVPDNATIDPASSSASLRNVLDTALDALRESNCRFCDMLENVEPVSLTLDLEFGITSCNDYLLQLTGWAREEVLGENWFDRFVPPELELGKLFQALLAGEPQAHHHVNEILTRSGERRLIQWNNSLLRSPAGAVIGTASTGIDVTERVRREEDLQRFRLVMDATADAVYMIDGRREEDLRRFRLVMDATADAIYLIDRDKQRVLDVNGAACRMLGYTREEILALAPEHIFSFTRDELVSKWTTLIERDGGADVIETWHRRKDGSRVPVEVERRAVRSGDTWIMVGVARDISVRKQAEEERRFQAHLLNTVGEALVASDVSGNIRYWNAQAEQIYGWSAEEAIGQNLMGTMFNDRRGELSKTVMYEIKQGRLWCGDHEACRKDGAPLSVQISVAPVRNDDGELTGLICVSRDISERRAAEQALRRSNERFEIVARVTNDIVWDWDVLDDTLWWNENMTSALGYDRAVLDRGAQSWYQGIHPEDYERVLSKIHKVIDSHAMTWQDEYRFRHHDGSYVTMFDRGIVIRDKAAKAIRMIGAMMDVTARKQAELVSALHAMQQSLLAEFGKKALASIDLDAIMDEAVVVVAKGLGVKFCRAMQLASDGASLIFKAGCGWDERWLGRHIPIADVDSRKRYDLHMNSQQPLIVDDFASETRFIASEILKEHAIVSAVEVLIRGPSGVYGLLGAYSCEGHAFSEEKVSFLRSISTTLGTAVERVRSEEKLAYLGQFDTLTGLPNRNLFHDRMSQTLTLTERNHWQAGVLYIDLDRFKLVNDTYGHSVADTLLMLVAQRIERCVRSGDTVGRLSGDEFAIVLSNLAKAEDANLVAQKILDELAHPFKLDDYETYVTASIGIALYPDDGSDTATLLKNADTAMYRAKEQGRNNFQFYTQALNTRVTHRINLERELRHAIEHHELELHYQPQVSLDTGRIVAAEALVRWRHPQRGLLAPAEFIAVAEESGLIVPIGQWVVDTACMQTMEWHRNGHRELAIGVNISPAEIRRGNVPNQIRAALERAGLSAQHLEVEITESMVMDNAESFIETLRALKKVGVMIAIDDFGTGYSNLSFLKRFPIDTIKIDQSFVRDIVTDTDDAVIVRAIIAMAHQLKLEVVAEGVETEAQSAFLRRHHIDFVQGFLFAPPLDAIAFGRLLDTHMSQPLPTQRADFPRSLLLVDDEENILRALKRTLRRDGYEIHTAGSAREGLDVLARTPIGVIVSDERMPEMNGSEFLARVKAVYPDTVRIMLSGYTDLKVVTTAVNEGAIYKFLTKPWEDDALREDIRQAFRRQEDKVQQRAAPGIGNGGNLSA